MMATEKRLHLTLDAEPESVGEARRAFQVLAEELDLREPQLGDLLTIVSEASANVVRHAYPTGSGTFEVEAFAFQGELIVVVRDFGDGLRPVLETETPSLKLGLGLISTLSSHFEISSDDEGTEIRVQIPLS